MFDLTIVQIQASGHSWIGKHATRSYKGLLEAFNIYMKILDLG